MLLYYENKQICIKLLHKGKKNIWLCHIIIKKKMENDKKNRFWKMQLPFIVYLFPWAKEIDSMRLAECGQRDEDAVVVLIEGNKKLQGAIVV